MDFESTPKEGSRFYSTVPLAPAIDKSIGTKVPPKGVVLRLGDGYDIKALVVDDVRENREILYRLLTDIGVDVQLAEHGLQAVERVRESMPAIAFMDIRMPILDGSQAAEQIWSEFGHAALKVVAISASALTHEQEKYLDMGFDDFISKPFNPEQIYDCLAELLGVEYEYEDAEVQDTQEIDASTITLPGDLIERLTEAAELYQVPKLKEYLDEVARLGSEARRLAQYLRQFADNYDMEGILNAVAEIQRE